MQQHFLETQRNYKVNANGKTQHYAKVAATYQVDKKRFYVERMLERQ